NFYFTSLRRAFVFVIIGVMAVIVGGFMMIYVIPPTQPPSTPPMQFRLENGFITSEEAKNSVHKPEGTTNFVFLKYTIMNNGGCEVIVYPSDPYSKKIIGNGSQINLPCFPYGFPNKIEG